MTIAYAKSVTIQGASVNNLTLIAEHLTAIDSTIESGTNITIHGDGESILDNSKNYGNINVNYPGTLRIINDSNNPINCGNIDRGGYTKPAVGPVAVGDIENEIINEESCVLTVTGSGFEDLGALGGNLSVFNGPWCASNLGYISRLKHTSNKCDLVIRLQVGRTYVTDPVLGTSTVDITQERYIMEDLTNVGTRRLYTLWASNNTGYLPFNFETDTIPFFLPYSTGGTTDANPDALMGVVSPG